jgi:uncharacterized membrane protein
MKGMSKVKNKHLQTKKMKKDNLKLQAQQGSWYHILPALIIAFFTVLGWFVTPYINKQVTSPQKNVLNSPEIETRKNLLTVIVTTGPNSPLNVYSAKSVTEDGM